MEDDLFNTLIPKSEEIDILIENMLYLEEQSNIQAKAVKHNNSQAIFKIPKIHFIRYILIYLDEMEIVKLTSVCRGIRNIIYSPVCFKTLMSFRTQQIPQREDQKTNKEQNKQTQLIDQDADIFEEDAIENIRTKQITNNGLAMMIIANKQEIDKQKTNLQSHQSQIRKINVEIENASEEHKKQQDIFEDIKQKNEQQRDELTKEQGRQSTKIQNTIIKLSNQKKNLTKQKAILIKYMKDFQEKINLAKDKNIIYQKTIEKMKPIYKRNNPLEFFEQ